MIKAIIGLGNPGARYYKTRHSIGFRVLDKIAEEHDAQWRMQDNREVATCMFDSHQVLLVKPQTFMNLSGHVIPFLISKNIKTEEILVVHDELEKPFGSVSCKQGGSPRGHNGLKSIIAACGEQFWRVRCGIGRPEDRDEVANYVLQPFTESEAEVFELIDRAITCVKQCVGILPIKN